MSQSRKRVSDKLLAIGERVIHHEDIQQFQVPAFEHLLKCGIGLEEHEREHQWDGSLRPHGEPLLPRRVLREQTRKLALEPWKTGRSRDLV